MKQAAERHEQLVGGYNRWKLRFGTSAPKYPSRPYVLLHSLSHVLKTEIALDCGYPASSLKERIYALGDGGAERCGILIYTASAGAQGALGGLVETAPRIALILKAASERTAIYSNDPVCCDHDPDHQTGDRATHGAACHGCLLIAETSCESCNLFLDRSLLVPTTWMQQFASFKLRRQYSVPTEPLPHSTLTDTSKYPIPRQPGLNYFNDLEPTKTPALEIF